MSQVLSADEVKKHNSSKSLWIVIRNGVYDVTAFLEEHPGGVEPLLEAAGQDATIAFDDVGHSVDAQNMLKKYKIGALAPGQGCSKYHRECTACDINSQKSSVKSGYKPPASPRIERRVPCIIVPREPSSKLKWALLALGLAIIIGVAYKKYAT